MCFGKCRIGQQLFWGETFISVSWQYSINNYTCPGHARYFSGHRTHRKYKGLVRVTLFFCTPTACRQALPGNQHHPLLPFAVRETIASPGPATPPARLRCMQLALLVMCVYAGARCTACQGPAPGLGHYSVHQHCMCRAPWCTCNDAKWKVTIMSLRKTVMCMY